MRKHIGAKIFSMLVIMLAVFVVTELLSGFSSERSLGALRRTSNTYVKLSEQNGILMKNIEECRLHGNLLIYLEDKEKLENVAKLTDEGIRTIDETFANMTQLCEEAAAYSNLNEPLQAYAVEVVKLQEITNEVKEAYLRGDQKGAVEANSKMRGQVLIIEEKAATFNTMLSEEVNALAEERITQVESLNRITSAMFFVYIGVVILMIVSVVRSISGSAKNASGHLTQIIGKIENNEGDLTERINVKTQDEVGQLVRGVNNFIGQLQGIMLKIREQSANMNEQVENITSGINDSNENASNVSATMEELSASMEEVKERADGVRSMATGSKSTSRMIGEIRALLEQAIVNSRSASKINELTGEILNISSQTNLLALNASIEAARAGEAGKGFAVVADEIRVLADSSRDTANNIQEISVLVTQAVDDLAKNSNDMLQFIDSTVIADYDQFEEVANQYHKDADTMEEMLQQFYNRAQELTNTMSQMTEGIDGINVAVDESAQGVTVAAQSTSQLVEALGSIKSEADANQEISRQLQGEVKRFKHI